MKNKDRTQESTPKLVLNQKNPWSKHQHMQEAHKFFYYSLVLLDFGVTSNFYL